MLDDPATALLFKREAEALKLITVARVLLMLLMAPLTWLLGNDAFDQIATTGILVIYACIVSVSAWFIFRHKHLGKMGLLGVGLDVAIIGLLPYIWFTSLGGGDLPVGFTFKTAVTLFALLLIALNALTLKPLYPLLVTVGALIVHLVLLFAAMGDSQTVFTQSYLAAYSTSELSIGRVTTQFSMLLLVGIILILLTTRARKTIIEASILERTNVQLGRYFSPNLVPKLAENPAMFSAGGERKELSFLFTDLEGFTSLVESHAPQDLVPVLNGYIDNLVKVAFKYEGTVDKIVGDAVNVIFGAPMEQEDHPQRALACALEMDLESERYRRQLNSKINFGVTRIGVNTGTAVVGNFGGDTMFDYTAYGDEVNICARLEGANKYLGTHVCVSKSTATQVENFQGRSVGQLQLQGKKRGIEAYEPFDQDRHDPELFNQYQIAFQALEAGDVDALKKFENLHKQFPKDELTKFHFNRLSAGKIGTLVIFDNK